MEDTRRERLAPEGAVLMTAAVAPELSDGVTVPLVASEGVAELLAVAASTEGVRLPLADGKPLAGSADELAMPPLSREVRRYSVFLLVVAASVGLCALS